MFVNEPKYRQARYNGRQKMKIARTIAGLLAASGAIFALIAWWVFWFWFGYVVWIGWIAVAAGARAINKRWFWIISAVWNTGMLCLFLTAADDGVLRGKTFIYPYARWHAFLATLASVYLSILGPSARQSLPEETNKSP